MQLLYCDMTFLSLTPQQYILIYGGHKNSAIKRPYPYAYSFMQCWRKLLSFLSLFQKMIMQKSFFLFSTSAFARLRTHIATWRKILYMWREIARGCAQLLLFSVKRDENALKIRDCGRKHFKFIFQIIFISVISRAISHSHHREDFACVYFCMNWYSRENETPEGKKAKI